MLRSYPGLWQVHLKQDRGKDELVHTQVGPPEGSVQFGISLGCAWHNVLGITSINAQHKSNVLLLATWQDPSHFNCLACFVAGCKTLVQRVGGSFKGSARLKLQSDLGTAPEIRVCFQQKLSEIDQAGKVAS